VPHNTTPDQTLKRIQSNLDRFNAVNGVAYKWYKDRTEELIYKTYKPNYKYFHLQTARALIVSALKKIDMLSILDDIETLRQIDPRYKLRKQLESGDEVLQYVERYNELIVGWACAAKTLETKAKEMTDQLSKGLNRNSDSRGGSTGQP
jgi:hypothetical protein